MASPTRDLEPMKRYRDLAVDQVGLLPVASTPAIIAPTVVRPPVERGQ